ncbi:hypothetical protein ACEWY4_013222 [Coilia grayii]|uniref:G-protein coupled receptors family 1 profile domain-containing protein n=1 Tax=Coilia grayii TaxID=363190 RepID=A0ABD1JVV0_9TELE
MFVFILLGFPINALTLAVTALHKKLRQLLNFILVNLAVAGLVMVVFGFTQLSTQKAEKEVTRMCVLMVFGFLLAWVPYASFAAWIFFNKGAAFSAQAMAASAFFSKSSALFNPLIYVGMNKQFRGCMMQTVFGKAPEDETSVSTSKTEVSLVSPA